MTDKFNITYKFEISQRWTLLYIRISRKYYKSNNHFYINGYTSGKKIIEYPARKFFF